MKQFLKINNKDNIVVALMPLEKGSKLVIEDKEVIVKESLDFGHKIAIHEIKAGTDIIKYGNPIGHANTDIPSGGWVHNHNIKTNLSGVLDYEYNKMDSLEKVVNPTGHKTFMGYKRRFGRAGIRNELWIIPTVGCVNGIGDQIIEAFKTKVEPSNIDAITIFKHNYGCSQLGQDHENTRKILGNMVKHPNCGGVLVLGLGCENNDMETFKASLLEYDDERVAFLIAQEVEDEIEAGVKALKLLYDKMKGDKREAVPISELVVGLKCGGSDGFSGITANPLLGRFSDYLVSQGGSSILTEVPEMFGAETLLMNRCVDEGTFNKTVGLINEFKEYYASHKQPIYENPSPGNKKGGISTLEEKSLGCVQKGGKSAVVDVLGYGEIQKTKGLNLLSAPVNDLIATTALGASG
jgi:altronate hydrolase